MKKASDSSNSDERVPNSTGLLHGGLSFRVSATPTPFVTVAIAAPIDGSAFKTGFLRITSASNLLFSVEFHLFFTAFPVRPGNKSAIFDHLLPHCC
jgi:hypothetical protein